MRYRGGGHKRRYRIIDFKRDKQDIPATVESIQYDPNRTAFIALLEYADGEKDTLLLKMVYKLVKNVFLVESGAAPEIGNAFL